MFIEVRRAELKMTGNGKVVLMEWDCGPDGVEIYAFDDWRHAVKTNASGLVVGVFKYNDLSLHHREIVRHNMDWLDLYYQMEDIKAERFASL